MLIGIQTRTPPGVVSSSGEGKKEIEKVNKRKGSVTKKFVNIALVGVSLD